MQQGGTTSRPPIFLSDLSGSPVQFDDFLLACLTMIFPAMYGWMCDAEETGLAPDLFQQLTARNNASEWQVCSRHHFGGEPTCENGDASCR